MSHPEAREAPERPLTFSEVVNELRVVLPRVQSALDRQHRPSVERLALRFDEVAAAVGLSRRLLERERAAGRFPAPDLKIGRCPLWRPETIRRWLENGGRS
jgi:predicted DNA-binding transcriptional regulator AlpA